MDYDLRYDMVEEKKIQKAADLLKGVENIVIFTGAGISKESGIPAFRGKDGLWENYRVEELATPYAFQRDPKKVWEWYNWRRNLISKAQPNPAHKTIAEMESFFPNLIVVTQNVDGLHKRAGSTFIIELHGNLWRARCEKEKSVFDFNEVPLKDIPPKCNCGSLIRPDVIWFGEALPQDKLKKAFSFAEECEAMMVIGTSALVQPSASLPILAKQNHAKIIEININPTPISQIADVTLFGLAGEILPRLFSMINIS